MSQEQFYRYVNTDFSLLRVYYRGQRDRRLFCIQCDPERKEEFYVCNKDGDPVCGLAMPEQWRLGVREDATIRREACAMKKLVLLVALAFALAAGVTVRTVPPQPAVADCSTEGC